MTKIHCKKVEQFDSIFYCYHTHILSKMNRIDSNTIASIPDQFPTEFNNFITQHKLKPPNINSGNGKALNIMLHNPNFYWTREDCDTFVTKFDIKTSDSIQLFNKHEQWGIMTSKERGKNYICYPYTLSNKHKMRKNFGKELSDQEKNIEINNLKATIRSDYCDVPNEEWELGHKNPESEDNSLNNLVLQPPIQGKYRDRYIFIDPLTKIPTPATLIQMDKAGENPFTKNQLLALKKWLNDMPELNVMSEVNDVAEVNVVTEVNYTTELNDMTKLIYTLEEDDMNELIHMLEVTHIS